MRFIHFIFSLIALTLFFQSCKKNEDKNFILMGTTIDARNGQRLGGASVTAEQQLLESGSFGGYYSTAASGTSDGTGHYHLEWENKNIVEARVTGSLDGYITRSYGLNAAAFQPGKEIYQTIELFPEALIEVRALKTGHFTGASQFNFRFENASFDCTCCTNNWRNYSPAMADSTFTCRVYGDSWLKYRYEVIMPASDTLIRDSIYCPRNLTTPLQIQW